MIPQAMLRIMVNPTNPSKPIGVDVVIDGQTVAVISADDFVRAVTQWNEIEENRSPEREISNRCY